MAAPLLSTNGEYFKVESKAEEVELGNLIDLFSLNLVADHLLKNSFRSPCFQFPDELVKYSTIIASYIESKTNIKCFVLADSSYSPCCVDEVAALHVNGDIVYHFGQACLNKTRSLPCVYVLQKCEINVDKIKREITTPCVLYADLDFILPVLNLDANHALPYENEFIPPINKTGNFTLNEIPNRKCLNEPVSKLVYISNNPSQSLILQFTTSFDELVVLNSDGDKVDVNYALKRRYRSVQQVKSSGTIGILLNTLSLKNTTTLLERIKQAITSAGKKWYMFVVGKPNVAKLGNFEAVDCWVVLGCPQSAFVLNDAEYFKPMVTPYELELGLTDQWTGKWLTRFSDIFTDNNVKEDSPAPMEQEEPLFDLVSGKFVFNNKPLRQVRHLDLNENTELVRSSKQLTIKNTVSTAAEFLKSKTWTGLGSDHDMVEEYAELKIGRSGIARDYNERANERTTNERQMNERSE